MHFFAAALDGGRCASEIAGADRAPLVRRLGARHDVGPHRVAPVQVPIAAITACHPIMCNA
jgi:hypothetical protein